jgi:hypothetical protein
MMALGQRKRGSETREVGESATTSSDVGSKRSSSGSEATNLMENINLSFPQHTVLLHRKIIAVPFVF